MCGIYLQVSEGRSVSQEEWIRKTLYARGPDSLGSVALTHSSSCPKRVEAWSSVLHVRGATLCPQPVLHRDGKEGPIDAFLMWNGEIFDATDSALNVSEDASDTALLAEVLFRRRHRAKHAFDKTLVETLSAIKGPFSFCFYSAKDGSIYYGRDRFGRRSLMQQRSTSAWRLASVLPMQAEGFNMAEEVPADGLYKLDVETLEVTRIHAWPLMLMNESIEENATVPTDLVTAEGSEERVLVQELEDALRLALQRRLPRRCKAQRKHKQCNDMGVLFSGGLDCSVLAALLHEILSPLAAIDLFNVSFLNPLLQKNDYNACPDRRTAIQSYEALRARYPERTFRLVCINVPYEDYLAHRSIIIRLMAPQATQMDLSIAAALYFAASRRGSLYGEEAHYGYVPHTKLLLSGLGADELMGGYTHHRAAYEKDGAVSLVQSMLQDVQRLAVRNLGRDDRIFSHHGVEVRFPYLDEDVHAFLLAMPLRYKCDLRAPRGLGDKRLLRQLAHQLGLDSISREVKRAIQFGSKSAKLETGKGSGYDAIKEDCPLQSEESLS